MSSAIDPDRLIAVAAPPAGPWSVIEVHPTLASTNLRAAALATGWSVVVAEHQSAGRGRLDRRWEAPAGTSLAVSATLPAPRHAPGWVPLLAGLAIAEAITDVTGLTAQLKWPNDVLLPADDNRKVCGVLCEYRPGTQGEDDLVIVGFGLNRTQARAELPVPTATSLLLAGAAPEAVEPVPLLGAILSRLQTRYAAWQAGGDEAAAVRAAYRKRCATLGTRVRLERDALGEVSGTCVEVDDDGAINLDDGIHTVAYAAGDVVHLRPARA